MTIGSLLKVFGSASITIIISSSSSSGLKAKEGINAADTLIE
eukprot:CAMPEP_0116545640 /NCGR_PEP_ID=MMETSP0397-20121206/2783_1 /TAXON_ID=216820 /ORGANISM="Cyclophora tenuis, Strain ECT3854" /LENGTH=41 /DNA_ID= /DNA_START= /DNA_END= /DNA_ORIENTATION=